jgi:hypothetical protein
MFTDSTRSYVQIHAIRPIGHLVPMLGVSVILPVLPQADRGSGRFGRVGR